MKGWQQIGGLCLAVGMMLSSASVAQAQEPADTAESHYELAVQLLGQGRYREARDEFDKAIALAPDDPYLYCNRAVAELKLDELQDALTSMETCRDMFEGDPVEKAQIDAQAQALRVFVSHLQPRSEDTARDIAAAPFIEKRIKERTPSDDTWDSEEYGFLSVAAGGTLLASALTLDILSADLREEFLQEAEGGVGTSQDRYDELEDEVRRRRRVFYSLTIGGALLTGLGATLLTVHYLGGDSPQPSASLQIAPLATPRHAGAQIWLTF